MLDLPRCKASLPAIINRSLIFALSSAMLPALMVFGQRVSAQRETITIAGTVRDAAGAPIDRASVILESKGQSVAELETSSDGNFTFLIPAVGSYRLKVQKAGFHGATAEQLLISPGERKHLDLVLERLAARQGSSSKASVGSAETIEFDEKPNFTIAGITDWSGAGGHGSDTSLRTSETLARETRSLQDQRTSAAKPSLPSEATADLVRARERVQQLLAKEERADLHRQLGDLDEQLNDPLAAVREYERAVALEPSEQNYFDWGTELLLHKGVQPAVEVFSKGAAAHPVSARMLAGLGAALYAAGSYDEAARKVCEAADRSPIDSAPYFFLGRMQKAATGPLPCVEQKLATFVQLQPANALAHYYYALAIWKRDRGASKDSADSDGIENILRRAVTLDPNLGEAHLQLGILYSERGNTEQAIAAYRRAIEANPNLGDVHYRLGQTYQKIGEQSKAQREFQLYDEFQKADAAEVERQRRDLRQFMVVLKEQPALHQ
jgi:tetratricopeptide (TPR) repeat protein